MIAYLKGKIIQARFGQLIVETGGVGYRVNVLPQIDVPENSVDAEYTVELYIHEHIREDAYDLYGFITYQELLLFQKLISVSGVGPKAGLNIMSQADGDKIISAIENSDVSFFTAISGIGKKVAAKIILELKSKISDSENETIILGMEKSNEVLEALTGLGYKKSDISPLLTKIPSDITKTEEKIRWVLKNLKK